MIAYPAPHTVVVTDMVWQIASVVLTTGISALLVVSSATSGRRGGENMLPTPKPCIVSEASACGVLPSPGIRIKLDDGRECWTLRPSFDSVVCGGVGP